MRSEVEKIWEQLEVCGGDPALQAAAKSVVATALAESVRLGPVVVPDYSQKDGKNWSSPIMRKQPGGARVR